MRYVWEIWFGVRDICFLGNREVSLVFCLFVSFEVLWLRFVVCWVWKNDVYLLEECLELLNDEDVGVFVFGIFEGLYENLGLVLVLVEGGGLIELFCSCDCCCMVVVCWWLVVGFWRVNICDLEFCCWWDLCGLLKLGVFFFINLLGVELVSDCCLSIGIFELCENVKDDELGFMFDFGFLCCEIGCNEKCWIYDFLEDMELWVFFIFCCGIDFLVFWWRKDCFLLVVFGDVIGMVLLGCWGWVVFVVGDIRGFGVGLISWWNEL